MTEPDAPNQPTPPGPTPTGPLPPHGQQPYGQQPWNGGYGPGWGGPAAQPRQSGVGLGVAALILGALGLVLPFLPMDLTGVRAFVGLPFAIAGLVLGVLGCTGNRTGKPAAITGLVLSALALVVSLIMLAGALRP